MQTQKMSLANIQGKLSRTEMKNIMAGVETVGGGTICYSATPCNETGTCGSYYVGNTEHCCCSVDKTGVDSRAICTGW